MTLHHYLDFEPALALEGWTAVEAGSSTAERVAAASFPDRGSTGLRVTIASTSVAYVQRALSVSIAAGEFFAVGFWMNVRTMPADSTMMHGMAATGANYWESAIALRADGSLRGYMRDDGGSTRYTGLTPAAIAAGQWHYIVWMGMRATSAVAADGLFYVYLDGHLAATKTGVDNYDKHAALTSLRSGIWSDPRDGTVIDFDEVKLTTGATAAGAYPEPYSPPAAADELPEAARTLVLYRQALAASREFADYCASELGVPFSHLVALPNATATESLASYATFETQVEDDLNAWLALHPLIAAKVSTIIIGYGVPGYFTDSGVVHSAASRLMNLATAFSSKTANGLYNPAAPGRLTKTALDGLYLCTRIDADTLAHAEAMIDAAAVVSALAALPDTDILYTSDADYRASLNCQHLRLQLAAVSGADASNAAFVSGDLTDLNNLISSGSRAALVDTGGYAATSLRSMDSHIPSALIDYGYASAIGWSNFTDAEFDQETFFEALRVGCTFAEAAIQSVKYLDYTAMPVGDPFMTVAFPVGGYNLYRGADAESSIDYDAPVAYCRPGDETLTLAVGDPPAEDRDYYYALRAVSDAGVEETNTVAVRVRVESGELVGLPPSAMVYARAKPVADGYIEVDWLYDAAIEPAAATTVQIAAVTAGAADFASPLAAETISGSAARTTTVGPYSTGAGVALAIRAVTAGSVAGPVMSIQPVVADATAPDAPPYARAAQED